MNLFISKIISAFHVLIFIHLHVNYDENYAYFSASVIICCFSLYLVVMVFEVFLVLNFKIISKEVFPFCIKILLSNIVRCHI